jgi:glycogen(starch) synthase
MRILVVSNLLPPSVQGGYELMCEQMTRQLRARGHAVRVLTSLPPMPFVADEQPDGDVVRALQMSEMLRLRRVEHAAPVTRRLIESASNFVVAGNVYALSREIDRFQPDVAYVWNLHGVGGLGLLAALEYRGLPWAWHLGDAAPMWLCQLDWRPLPRLARAVTPWLRGSWLACSTRVVDEIRNAGLGLEGRIEMVPGWADEPEPPPAVAPYRPGEPLRVVYSGSVATFKGVGILIDATAQLRADGLDVRLDLLGPVLDADLQDRAHAHSLGDAVTFRGQLPHQELLQGLGRGHVFAFATHEREPFGIAPLQAAARGVVPLLSESCGISEWLVDGVNCLKAARTAPSFAATLRRIATGEIELGPLARRARATTLRDFEVRHWAPRVESVLEDAAGRGGGLTGSTLVAHRAALVAEQIVSVTVEEATPA